MGRATVTLRAEDSGTRVVDRSANGGRDSAADGLGIAAGRSPGVDALLPGPTTGSSAGLAGEGPHPEPEVILPEVWWQLPVPERQRFGHRFSFMVLKALGLRPCPTAEVES
jgi:hypothetical protein